MKQTTIYDFLQPNFVQQIYDFNQQAGLLDSGYDDFRESSFQIEEALEGFPSRNLLMLSQRLGIASESPKDVSRVIALIARGYPNEAYYEVRDLSDVERLDKAIDAIVFAIGSIAKLGLNVEQIHRAVGVVTETNLQKLTCPKDKHGKLSKPADFVGPEAKLQAILDERNT